MNDKERVDKHAKVAMLIISSIIILLFAIALSGCKFNEEVHEGLKNDPRGIPSRMLNWEIIDLKTDSIDMDSFITYPWYNPDSIMNDVDMDCGEYHGKEGKSEYGEYVPNE